MLPQMVAVCIFPHSHTLDPQRVSNFWSTLLLLDHSPFLFLKTSGSESQVMKLHQRSLCYTCLLFLLCHLSFLEDCSSRSSFLTAVLSQLLMIFFFPPSLLALNFSPSVRLSSTTLATHSHGDNREPDTAHKYNTTEIPTLKTPPSGTKSAFQLSSQVPNPSSNPLIPSGPTIHWSYNITQVPH